MEKEHNHQYVVKVAGSGCLTTRNRKFLHKFCPVMEAHQEPSPYNVISPSPVGLEQIPYQPLPLVPERPAVTPLSVSPSSVTS